jgi:hypothetical protein
VIFIQEIQAPLSLSMGLKESFMLGNIASLKIPALGLGL